MRVASTAAVVSVALSVACGPTGPSSATPPASVPVATGAWAPDLEQVTEQIVGELRVLGLDVVMAERIPASVLSAGARRVDIPSLPDDSIWIHVYRTAEAAAREAARIPTGGNAPRSPGPAMARVTYVRPMHFYHRDRVIAVYGGCDARFKSAMQTLFGPPVETTRTCW